MDISNNIVLIKGEDKTLSVEHISDDDKWRYVKFKGTLHTYKYTRDSVVWIKNLSEIDLLHCRVFINGKPNPRVVKLKKGSDGLEEYYLATIMYKNSTEKESYSEPTTDKKESTENITTYRYKNRHYPADKIEIRKSCLQDNAITIFEYLKRCASLSEIGKDKNNPESIGTLERIYRKIDYLDPSTIASIYFNPISNLKHSELSDFPIFPFGTNRSQMNAVKQALDNRISVIQGPPGTGKTQTILNIIANLLLEKKTILIVSSNNSATANILEKLDKHGFGFLVAPLGSNKNKKAFIESQPEINPEITSWSKIDDIDRNKLQDFYRYLKEIFNLQEQLADRRLELSEIQLEKQHFEKEVMKTITHLKSIGKVSSKNLLEKLHKLNRLAEVWPDDYKRGSWDLRISMLRFIIKLQCRFIFNIYGEINSDTLHKLISEHERAFYLCREEELKNEILSTENRLASTNSKSVTEDLVDASLKILKLFIARNMPPERIKLKDTSEIFRLGSDFLKGYPIVLSTTFSSRFCMGEYPLFDYVIMDEASQVSIETGVLALSCARNAVIVGDNMQLPNVVQKEDREKLYKIEKKLNSLYDSFKIPSGYNCAVNSFLSSVLQVIPDIPVTLLREHYRCHPDIINFCNQKFYNGDLQIMTKKGNNDTPLEMRISSEGKHQINRYNQREIDIIKKEILPTLDQNDNIGIISPYKNQVSNIKEQLRDLDAATVHKFQGREKDTVIFSVTDDVICDFSDNANLLNVAVSRAKEKFILVVSGNKQDLHGNIHDLMQYIAYCNGKIIKSRLNSIFDNLHNATCMNISHRSKRLENQAELQTWKLIISILNNKFANQNLGCVSHYSLRKLISDYSRLIEDEIKYASHPNTHIDFLIYNKTTHQAIMAIETDGYTYHNKETIQYERDQMKNRILEKYGLPIERLQTNGCDEEKIIQEALSDALKIKTAANCTSPNHGTTLFVSTEE